MSFKNIIDLCQIEAISNKLSPTEESVFRVLCREYSKRFSTPLHLVKEMPLEEIALEIYESNLDQADADENLEKWLETIYMIEDPEYAQEMKEELDSFIEKSEKEEEERLAKNKPIHPGMKKEGGLDSLPEPKKKEEVKSKDKTSGFLDLSYLENHDNER